MGDRTVVSAIVGAALLTLPLAARAAPVIAISDASPARQGWGLVVNRDGEASDLASLGAELHDGPQNPVAMVAGYGWRRGNSADLVLGYRQPAAAGADARAANPRYPGQTGAAEPAVLGLSFSFRR